MCRSTEVIAHRGASAAAREHTDLAYELALAQGADVLELDVRATADGELVIVHDTTLTRTAGDPRRVEAITARELQRLPRPLRPLSLDHVLERYGEAARLLIELKDPRPSWEALACEAVERLGLVDRVAIQSFDVGALARLRARRPRLELVSLHLGRPSAQALGALGRWAAGIAVWHPQVDARLVAAARAAGLAVRAFTVNEPAQIDRLLDIGVDGVITDVPQVAIAAARAREMPEAA